MSAASVTDAEVVAEARSEVLTRSDSSLNASLLSSSSTHTSPQKTKIASMDATESPGSDDKENNNDDQDGQDGSCSRKPWTKEEDAIILKSIEEAGDYTAVSSSAARPLIIFSSVLKSVFFFSDLAFSILFPPNGSKVKWLETAKDLPGRTGKQCR